MRKGVEVHSDIRELILELLSRPSNEPLQTATVTRLIWLAGLRVHPLLKVTLRRLGVIATRQKPEIQNWAEVWRRGRWATCLHSHGCLPSCWDNLSRTLWSFRSRQDLTVPFVFRPDRYFCSVITPHLDCQLDELWLTRLWFLSLHIYLIMNTSPCQSLLRRRYDDIVVLLFFVFFPLWTFCLCPRSTSEVGISSPRRKRLSRM